MKHNKLTFLNDQKRGLPEEEINGFITQIASLLVEDLISKKLLRIDKQFGVWECSLLIEYYLKKKRPKLPMPWDPSFNIRGAISGFGYDEIYEYTIHRLYS